MLAFMLGLILLGALLPGAALAAPSGPAAQSTAESGWGCSAYHTVSRGETLSGIAGWYGVSVRALMQANGIWNPNHIYVGQVLCIPGGGYPPQPQPQPPWPEPQPKPWPGQCTCTVCHIVRHGESLSMIASYYGVSPHAIAECNRIYDWNHIYAGQKLCIPGHYYATATATAATAATTATTATATATTATTAASNAAVGWVSTIRIRI